MRLHFSNSVCRLSGLGGIYIHISQKSIDAQARVPFLSNLKLPVVERVEGANSLGANRASGEPGLSIG